MDRTHIPHKAEHAVDLATSAIVGVTVQGADQGDTTTSIETLIEAAEQVEAVRPDGEDIEKSSATRATTAIERIAIDDSVVRAIGRVDPRQMLGIDDRGPLETSPQNPRRAL